MNHSAPPLQKNPNTEASAPGLNEGALYGLSTKVIAALLVICALPLTLNFFGVDFASVGRPIDLEQAAAMNLTKNALADLLFYALTGGLQHALLEWSSVMIAVVTVLLSFTHYQINRDIMVPIIGMALLCSGLIDAFHTLAAMRLITAVAPNTDLIPFTWALSRGFHAAILIVGVMIALFSIKNRVAPEMEHSQKGLLIVAVVSLIFVAVAYTVVNLSATSANLPQTQYPGALITRPYDVIPLALFLLAAPLFWALHQRTKSLFSAGLLLVLLPEMALEAHMAFGSSKLFDNHFNIAHGLKIVAYFVPFTGLLLDYVKTYSGLRKEVLWRQRTQVQLVVSKEKAEKATRMKSEFLANMSHEIRTPMNGVIGTTGLLLDTKLTNKQRHFATTTMRSAESLLDLINDILDFSKIEAGKLDLETVPFDMHRLASEVSEVLAFKCREKKIEFLLHIPQGTAQHVEGDPSRVRQILFNILSNAVKFTEKGHVLLTVRSVNLASGKVEYQISVEDTGIGIPENKMEAVFKQFDQADTSTTRNYGGTGLGLTICRNLAKMMGGGIKVESVVGQGSTFSFTVLVDPGKESDIPTADISADVSLLRGLRVLSVDDSKVSNKIVVEQLQGLVAQATAVETGKLALDAMVEAEKQGIPFDIVITDFYMPEMNGEELIRHVQENPAISDVAFVLITSAPRRGDGSRMKDLGFSGYLTKPIFPHEIPLLLSSAYKVAKSDEPAALVTRHNVNATAEETDKKLALKNTHILLVEDNAVNLMVAESILQRYGCFVTPAGNGKEAVDLVRQREFDLIFMDCQMPVMDGFEASGKIREHEEQMGLSRCPIIAFTANAMEGDREICIQAGMDDYLAKPVRKELMEAVLVKWLGDKVDRGDGDEELDVIDFDVVESLSQLTDGQHIDIIQSYLDFAKGAIEAIEKAVVENDPVGVREHAHALKASSKQLGAMHLGDLSGELELRGLNKDLVGVEPLIRSFSENGKKVLIAFETYVQQNSK